MQCLGPSSALPGHSPSNLQIAAHVGPSEGRWRWMWQSEMHKFRYCDVVWDSRDVLEEDELNHLLDVVDEGYRDARFDPGLMTNDEVGLYVSFSRAGETVEVRVRKKPKEGMAMKAMMNLITLEFLCRRRSVGRSWSL